MALPQSYGTQCYGKSGVWKILLKVFKINLNKAMADLTLHWQ